MIRLVVVGTGVAIGITVYWLVDGFYRLARWFAQGGASA